MERVIEIIKEWGFKSETKGHYYKFVTPDSCVSIDFTEDEFTITFKALCGAANEELTKMKESWKLRKMNASKDPIRSIIKGCILKLTTDLHNKYLFNE